jgi:hypothetical protein
MVGAARLSPKCSSSIASRRHRLKAESSPQGGIASRRKGSETNTPRCHGNILDKRDAPKRRAPRLSSEEAGRWPQRLHAPNLNLIQVVDTKETSVTCCLQTCMQQPGGRCRKVAMNAVQLLVRQKVTIRLTPAQGRWSLPHLAMMNPAPQIDPRAMQPIATTTNRLSLLPMLRTGEIAISSCT